MGTTLNTGRLNSWRPNNSTSVPSNLVTEMYRLLDSKPKTKVEFITVGGVVTDISDYYLEGARFEQIKERAADEIQAGDFDVVLSNQDDKFSEYVSTSLIYGVQYHGARIRISLGFVLDDGTESYVTQGVGYIDQIIASDGDSKVTFRCRDLIRRIMDQTLNPTPLSEVPVFSTANAGNGTITDVATKPFKTKNELWTVTCTLGGGDGVATFSVVGATTGSAGTATSGTEFSTGDGIGGIKFTITAGSTSWSSGDSVTFTTKQYPEWTSVNPAKIIWNVLTGYDWDSGTISAFSGLLLDLDHTKSTSNTELDYTSFVTAIANLDKVGSFSLKGYVPRDQAAVDFIQDILLLFLGSIFTNGSGLIAIKTYAPTFGANEIRQFSDANKITLLGFTRSIDEVINYCVSNYKKIDKWEFSDTQIDYTGSYVSTDSASIAKYKIISTGFGVRWYTSNGNHVQDFTQKLVGRYAEPPLNIDFQTGADGLQTIIGDYVQITDTKYNFDHLNCEVARITKNLDERPIHITMRVRRDPTLDLQFAFLGSSASEGDGLSPQTLNYDSASATDKLFGYLGQTGGGTGSPNYRMF